ncbi:hypothetical protein LMG1864_04088 [Achromobacter ruhlandii]|nr:hypothetical protein LMG1864_04088 [Achromobacter ruhlandii]
MTAIHAGVGARARAIRQRHGPQAQARGRGLEPLPQIGVAGGQAQKHGQAGSGHGGRLASGKTGRRVEQTLDMAARQAFRGQQMNQFATAVELRVEHERAAVGVKPPAACPGSVAG